MPRASHTRRLIRQMSFADAKEINLHYGLPPRRSQEELANQIVLEVGAELDELVSAAGPYSLARWNEIAGELGASPRKSFAALGKEIAVNLDPVYDHIDANTTISTVRTLIEEKRNVARIFGIRRPVLEQLLADAQGSQHFSTFVKAYRLGVSTAARAPRQQSPMSVASTRVQAASVDRMSIPWMVQQVQDADVLRIAAGFYDTDFLEDILKNCKAHTVCLMFNGLGGQRLHAQRGELDDLAGRLKQTGRKVNVRLSFAPGMFHSKLFLVTDNGKVRALMGSANATSAAFSRNEEILVSLAEAGPLDGYFDAAWQDARELHSMVEPANSLISFFRTGVLYFKPTATLVTTVHPFLDLLKRLTDEERALLGGVKLPFADQVAGIGPFNLKHAIQDIAGLEDWEDPDSNTESEKIDNRVSIKPWAVETCFGYWVPSRLDTLWNTALRTAGAAKRKKIEAFAKELKQIDRDSLNEMYQRYLDEVKKVLEERIPRLPALLNQMQRSPFDLAFFEKFVVRIIAYLDDAGRIKRLAEPFISGAMPELWDDEHAYLDFRASYFDYLDHVARIKRSHAKVARIILDKLKVAAPIGSEAEWSSMFEEFFEDQTWTEEDWMRGFKTLPDAG